MPRLSDEALIAFMDGEASAADAAATEAALADDAGLRLRYDRLSRSTAAVRGAFDTILHEPVPDFLIGAARAQNAATPGAIAGGPSDGATVVPFVRRPTAARRRWLPLALAASVCGLLVGAGGGYYGSMVQSGTQATQTVSAATGNLLDNLAGNYKLLHGSAATEAAYDIPGDGDGADPAHKLGGHLPSQFKVPDLKPWGLTFQGARMIVVEGGPAAQLSYSTDNKELGPLTVVVFPSKRPDVAARIEQRQGVNLLYWRHAGKAVAIVSGGDKNYMWKLGNDVGYQLGAL